MIGFVNDFVIENKGFRKREPACGRAAGEVGMRFFNSEKIRSGITRDPSRVR